MAIFDPWEQPCAICGEPFYPDRSNQKCCGPECQEQRKTQMLAERHEARKWDRAPRTCEICGDSYTPKSHNQRYCGPGCSRQSLSEYTLRGRFVVFHRDGFCCIYCGRSPIVDQCVVLHLEHVVPRHCGGDDRLCNLVTACSRCNLEKGHAPLTESAQHKILSEIERRNDEGGFNPRTIIKFNG